MFLSGGLVPCFNHPVEIGHANNPESLVVAQDYAVHFFAVISECLSIMKGCELEYFLRFHG